MPAAKKTSSITSAAPPRRRGRPPRVESPIHSEATVTRAAILERAIALSKQIPLDQISMVQLAKEFGVAPGLIHYYLGGRDQLISGVLNHYYAQRVGRIPALTGDWRTDVQELARASFAVGVENPGVSIYVASHNRHRLFQEVGPDEVDYGLVYFNHLTSAFKQGGFTPEQTALAYHLLAQFLVSSTMAEAARQLPAHHEGFILKKLESASANQYPGARYVRSAFAKLGSDTAFEAGLKILLDGFAAWLTPSAAAAPRKRARKTAGVLT
ncbi:TetR/AcrR family transcriptional regulator [Verticiella sediminum]|uniref:TetR/AcrR family transcriptional regulator n=1 Tax=Verticiella sediminum TaxID=1247510 RepID=A0A556AWP4_9BURK|nr:TetR/AcrR family transcriptional regulator C-terminal domain-containing protein [Verticiella sediminum]TSH97350.1 TetR/AcrR family transcriptional regulator [Verticiella sediminum]